MWAAWCWNTAWMASGRLENAAFRRDMLQPAKTQQKILLQMLAANRDSDFGRQHNFARIRNSADFQQRVPPSSYDDFRPYIDRIARGETNVLTTEPVTCLHPTGGSSGGEKLIPYTRSSRRQFQRALQVWIADLFAHCPAVRRGRAYWSLSPALGPMRRSPGGIAIGFENDTEYLGAAARWAARQLLVAPNWLAQVADLETFRYLTLWHLLAADDLALISVWSPTFLTGLLRDLDHWRQPLLDDLATGRPSSRVPESLRTAAYRTYDLHARRRADHLRAVLSAQQLTPAAMCEVWPRLALVSCWADGPSAVPFTELKAMLPDVTFQPKGLLATEAFTSIPLWHRPAAAVAIRSHFFEFIEEHADAATARPRLVHELEIGGRYEVMLTTAGGLYRYRTGDCVAVVDHTESCPLIRFEGRCDGTSDLVGEKLSSAQVESVLHSLWLRLGQRPSFALLTTVASQPPRYRLYLQSRNIDADRLAGAAAWLEKELAANPHYRYAVGLRQLDPIEIVLLDPAGPAAWDLYCRQRAALGQRWGDIKPTALDRSCDWTPTFAPWVIARFTAADKSA